MWALSNLTPPNKDHTGGNHEETSRLSGDRKRRSETLCSWGDKALLKGDIELAERLFIQADVYDPRNGYAEDRLRRVDEKRQEPEGALALKNRHFDFLYAPTLRGLSTELSSLLPLHPGVFSVSKTELDLALEHGSESLLLAKYQRQILNKRPDLKAGLVQHAFIADQLAGPEIAERLSKITSRRLFVHGVRDPIQLTISDFNLELVARYCGAYTFRGVYPGTPFGQHNFLLPGLRVRTSVRLCGQRALNRLRGLTEGTSAFRETPRFPLDRSVLEGRLDEALSRARHFAVGSCYARHFDEWIPIDLERQSRHVANRLFEIIGVDANFEHPALRVSEGTSLHRLMVQNQLNVGVQCLGLGFAERSMYSNTFRMSELFTLESDNQLSALGISHQPLCITVCRDQWRSLPRDIRIRLVETDSVRNFCDSVLLPAWVDGYARWKSATQKYLIQELQPRDIERLRARIGTDLELFLKRHPLFERAWPSAIALVGR